MSVQASGDRREQPIDSNESLKDYMDARRPAVEAALQAACEDRPGVPERLAAAIRYAVLAPGKRLRPMLTIMAAEACGGDAESAMPSAVAVEMIHAYSLIHDDLPAMDDDDLRRGRPTTHIEFDEATAILAGDALQSMAFAHLHHSTSDATKSAALIGTLATAAGRPGWSGAKRTTWMPRSTPSRTSGGRMLPSNTSKQSTTAKRGLCLQPVRRWAQFPPERILMLFRP